MRNRPIRSQFLLVFSSLLGLLILCLFVVNLFLLKPYYVWTKTEQLKTLNSKFDAQSLQMQDPSFQKLIEEMFYRNQATLDIYDATGMNVFSTRNPKEQHEQRMRESFTAEDMERLTSGDFIVRQKQENGRNLLFLTVYRMLPDGRIISLSSAMAAIDESVRVFNQFLLPLLLLFLIIAWVSATKFANYFSRPIVSLQQMAHRMTEFDFSQSWKEQRRDELGNLGENMNQLTAIIGQFTKELQGKNEQLEVELERKSRMEQDRKRFVSDVSHELKTPIALIQGYAEGLRLNVNEDEASRNEYCDVITDEARKMNELVKELLLLSRLESEQAALHPQPFNLEDTLRTAVTRLQNLYTDQDIQFALDLQPQAACVVGDASKINQVLTNYLTNAAYFGSKPGLIRISSTIMNNRVRISVYNSGPNIPEAELAQIWDSFYKVDKARTRGDSGTGLGLSIVKRIIELHGTSCGAQNTEDGVVFWFELQSCTPITNTDGP